MGPSKAGQRTERVARRVALASCVLLGACSQVLKLPDRVALPNVESCTPEGGCACAPGFEDCDGVLDNGCEVDLTSGARCECKPITWPTPPQGADTGGNTNEAPIVLALRSIAVKKDNKPVGFDLDKYCSCRDAADSPCPCATVCDCEQVPIADSCKPVGGAEPVCDGGGGVDNALEQLLSATAGFTGLDVKKFGDAAAAGVWSLLIVVRGYDGTGNDSAVDVALYGALPFDQDPCNAPGAKPAWNGEDRWTVRADALEGGTELIASNPMAAPKACGDTLKLDFAKPVLADVNAYVADGQLVAQWPAGVSLSLSGTSATISFTLEQAVMAGSLLQDGPPRPGGSDATWRFRDVTFGGRWPEEAMLSTLGNLSLAGDTRVCDNPATLAVALSFACPLLDVRNGPGGPTSPCDALSFGLAFEADEARFGSVRVASSIGDTCETKNVDLPTSCSN